MTYIALFRNGRDLRQCKVVDQDHIDVLFTFAHAGDTLHNIPEEMTHNGDDVLRVVRGQLERGDFVPV